MLNDADLEMMEIVDRAIDAHNGVCSICEEALYPMDPKWNNDPSYSGKYTQEIAAELVGPVHPQLPYHVRCLEDS